MEKCRARLMSLGIILLYILAVRADADSYDEDPSSDYENDAISMNDNVVKMESVVPVMGLGDPLMSLFVYKLMKSLGTSDEYLDTQERQKWNRIDDSIISLANNDGIKLPTMKRSAINEDITVKPQAKLTRPTNKPPKKPKNREIGSQFICYLKLCNLLTKYNNKLE